MSEISITIKDGVQLIKLNRTDKKNALTGDMYNAMREALERAETNDDVVCHVFVGSGGMFTSGNDVNDFMRRAATPPKPGERISAPSTDFIRTLPKVTKPMIAAVDGLAVGIGVTLLLHCDLVLASPTATFRAPFVNLGIIQEAGSSVIGPERLGYQAAFELLILGALWDANRAKEAGLANWIVPSAELEARALAVGAELAGKPREALYAARRMMRGGSPERILATIEQEVQIYTKLFRSPKPKRHSRPSWKSASPTSPKRAAPIRSDGPGNQTASIPRTQNGRRPQCGRLSCYKPAH